MRDLLMVAYGTVGIITSCLIFALHGGEQGQRVANTNAANVQLTNPLADATMDESGKDAPIPGGNAEAEEEPLISSTTTGAGEEFDCTKTLNRPLTWWEKKLARKARKIALSNGWRYAPLEEAGKIGTHAMTVVVKGKEAPSDLAGIYYRDTPLEEWEKQLARTLLDLAKDGGSEEK